MSDKFPENLPFNPGDITAGCENEMQAAVVGGVNDVDLPLSIRGSSYFANVKKRAQRGDMSEGRLIELEEFLTTNTENVWENSWAAFPQKFLSDEALQVFRSDLLKDKTNPSLGIRQDSASFFTVKNGERMLRIPVSYLLKLALADLIAKCEDIPQEVANFGKKMMDCFSNDNTSPEIHSFSICGPMNSRSIGSSLSRETLLRFLLTQVLASHANIGLECAKNNQEVMVFFSSLPPSRLKKLNGLISDAFYRELFMSPCLSGWNRGEEKMEYMSLCHRVMSRSHLGVIAKLRESGILNNNLVVLPHTSHTGLANNGTHVSLGSLKLKRVLSEDESGRKNIFEKRNADLVAKIMEHFLPLFVGTYSASPLRIAFEDFHPEHVLGYLPHELDYGHLRMLWRRWKKKASLSVFGHPLTPVGPQWIDRNLERFLGLKGDHVPDYRLIDYFVSLMSTPNSPSLDGVIGNDERLKKDLSQMGVFDERMSTYLLYKMRAFSKMGFSGFEGRFYSVFPSLKDDMAPAVDLQALLTCLAWKYVLAGTYAHRSIPDTPEIESERRQAIFGAALGIPTFFVEKDTKNAFLRGIISKCPTTRFSRRYPGTLRVLNDDYRLQLIHTIREDGADIIEMFKATELLADLEKRIRLPEFSAHGKLTRSVLSELGISGPMKASAHEFNSTMERFFRTTLREKHLQEAFRELEGNSSAEIDKVNLASSDDIKNLFKRLLTDMHAEAMLHERNIEWAWRQTGNAWIPDTSTLTERPAV
jgi:hypothetical protein